MKAIEARKIAQAFNTASKIAEIRCIKNTILNRIELAASMGEYSISFMADEFTVHFVPKQHYDNVIAAVREFQADGYRTIICDYTKIIIEW